MINVLENIRLRYHLSDFWEMSPEQSQDILLEAILEGHAWHYARNPSYRRTVAARGVRESASPADLSRLLRPTAQTFKSYIEVLGTPFAQDKPLEFIQWVKEQLSVEIPARENQFRRRYPSLEKLLADFERIYADQGFEILTSSGTSGRSTIMLRDQEAIARTVESFYLSFQRYLGMRADHQAIFIMPKHSRIAMARMAGFSFREIGLPDEQMHYTIPYPAYPDQVRVRAGRTYRSGWRGLVERRIMNPFMNWAFDRKVMPKAVQQAITLLEAAQASGEKVLVFGGWIQLHNIALELRLSGRALSLAPGSIFGTGGGFKELYPYSASQIRQDIAQVIELTDGQPIPLRDVYGMAEGNWAAMQCAHGSYHIPPWIYAVTVDRDDQLQMKTDSTGLLAFFDPLNGGKLFPAFFKTADQVRLVNGAGGYDRLSNCPCEERGAYIMQGSIQRVDLVDEAGCAAQL